MKKFILLTMLGLALTAVNSSAQFTTNFCTASADKTLTIDTTSVEGAVAIKFNNVTGALWYGVSVAAQSAVSDTSLYFNSWTGTSNMPTVLFPYYESKILYWVRGMVCTSSGCCFTKVTAFTSASRYSTTINLEPAMGTDAAPNPLWQPAFLKGTATVKKP